MVFLTYKFLEFFWREFDVFYIMDINFSIEDYKWLGEANVTLTSDDGFVIKCHQSVLGSIDMNMRLAFYHEKLDFYAVSLTGMNQIMLKEYINDVYKKFRKALMTDTENLQLKNNGDNANIEETKIYKHDVVNHDPRAEDSIIGNDDSEQEVLDDNPKAENFLSEDKFENESFLVGDVIYENFEEDDRIKFQYNFEQEKIEDNVLDDYNESPLGANENLIAAKKKEEIQNETVLESKDLNFDNKSKLIYENLKDDDKIKFLNQFKPEEVENILDSHLVKSKSFMKNKSSDVDGLNKNLKFAFESIKDESAKQQFIYQQMTFHSKLGKGQGLLYECNICQKKGKRYQIEDHIKTQHLDIMVSYACHKCDFIADRKSSLVNHRKIHYDILVCNQCPFTSTGNSILEKHKESVHEGKRYPCPLCEKFISIHGLKAHVKIHKKPIFICELCTLTFNKKSSQEIHMRNIHNTENLKCNDCEFITSKMHRLLSHTSSQHKKGGFQCEHCIHYASDKHRLEKHINSMHKQTI